MRFKFFDAVLQKLADGKTKVVSGASVYVYKTGTVTLATIYDNDSVTTLDNPLTTDSNGNYEFIADAGTYDIRIVYTGYDEQKNKVPIGTAEHVNGSIGTGLLDGGVLSINADNTKYDISAGNGIHVDAYTDPNLPVITFI